MTRLAVFGPPLSGMVDGGTHVTVYLVPVYQGRLVVFDVRAKEARGRWLPWTMLDFGGNPYEVASDLAELWCGGRVSDLSLADVMSFEVPADGWELAIVFRAELTGEPVGDSARAPYVFERGRFDAIGPFDPVDMERWVASAPRPGSSRSGEAPQGLLF